MRKLSKKEKEFISLLRAATPEAKTNLLALTTLSSGPAAPATRSEKVPTT